MPKTTDTAQFVPKWDFEQVRAVIVPTLKHPVNATVYVLIASIMETKPDHEGGEITLVDVVDLADNSLKRYPLNSIVRTELVTAYTDGYKDVPEGDGSDPLGKADLNAFASNRHDYLGKVFMIEKLPKQQGRRYNDMRCSEIAVPKEVLRAALKVAPAFPED